MASERLRRIVLLGGTFAVCAGLRAEALPVDLSEKYEGTLLVPIEETTEIPVVPVSPVAPVEEVSEDPIAMPSPAPVQSSPPSPTRTGGSQPSGPTASAVSVGSNTTRVLDNGVLGATEAAVLNTFEPGVDPSGAFCKISTCSQTGFTLGDIPYLTADGSGAESDGMMGNPEGYFRFVFDLFEQLQVDGQVTLNSLTISAAGRDVWSLTADQSPLSMNFGTRASVTSTMGDAALLVPIRAFLEAETFDGEFTSSTPVAINWTVDPLSLDFASSGTTSFGFESCDNPRVSCFDGDVYVLPVPGALPLLLTGLAGIGWMGWRRRAA